MIDVSAGRCEHGQPCRGLGASAVDRSYEKAGAVRRQERRVVTDDQALGEPRGRFDIAHLGGAGEGVDGVVVRTPRIALLGDRKLLGCAAHSGQPSPPPGDSKPLCTLLKAGAKSEERNGATSSSS